MSEPTPLPEPYQFLEQDDASLIPFEAVYSESQIKAAMDAEYARGVADSAKEIERLIVERDDAKFQLRKLREHIQGDCL